MMASCRTPSPPPHFPDFRSTPSPIRRRLPRPLPDPPGELPFSAISTSSSSSLASSRASSTSSSPGDSPDKVLAIIHEIDAALHYTNSQRQRQRPLRFSSATNPSPPASASVSPTRQRPVSASSYSSSAAFSSLSCPRTRARTLRRVFSPRDESLREVRARDSDICLQRVYERQVMMYLDGSIFAVRPLQRGSGAGGDGGGDWWGEMPP